MPTRNGKALMVLPTQQVNNTRAVTEVIARANASEMVPFYIDRASPAPVPHQPSAPISNGERNM